MYSALIVYLEIEDCSRFSDDFKDVNPENKAVKHFNAGYWVKES